MRLQDLPDVEFLDTDTETIKNSIITIAEGILGRKLARADPLRLFLNSLALIIIQQRVAFNHAFKMNLLAYTKGDAMDHIGNFIGCDRIEATAATTTVQVTLSAVQNHTVIVPVGTRVATDDNVVFSIEKDIDVPIGSQTATGRALCQQKGTIGNGYDINTVKNIVDNVPYVAKITNITATEGGAERESDEAYRERIHEAPEKIPTTGPTGAYAYYAKQASSNIVDVAVESPSPGKVTVYPLLTNGELPEDETLALVKEKINADDVRPLTDYVTVSKPTTLFYTINLTYYISSADKANQLTIKQKVEQAVRDYVIWQKSKLGRDINRTELYYRVRAAGAKRVEITSPASDTVVNNHQVAIASTTNALYGGLEDE